MIKLLEGLGFVPRVCVWELTLTCNLSCLHCGSYAGPPREDELTFEECMSVADQLAALGCEKVTLGGGEPTLRARWSEIARRLTDHGVRVNMVTNGWLWSEEVLQKAKAGGLTNIAFSLDGFEEPHDTVRRTGSFQRVLDAMRMCRAGGMPISAVTHVNKLNYRSLPAFRDLLSELGVGSWQIQLGNPMGAMAEHPELVIEPEALLWFVPQIAKLRGDDVARPVVCPGDNIGYYGSCERALRDQGARVAWWIGCRAGCGVVGIESNGNIKGCLSLPSARHSEDLFHEGNLREASLAELWEAPDAFSYNRGFTVEQLGGFCAVCRYGDICRGGCSWTAFCHTRNRFEQIYCLYRQAVIHRRFDLLGYDRPSEAELAFAEVS